jgi:hypothetical protein
MLYQEISSKTSANPSDIVVSLGVTGRFKGGDSDNVLVEEEMVETNTQSKKIKGRVIIEHQV